MTTIHIFSEDEGRISHVRLLKEEQDYKVFTIVYVRNMTQIVKMKVDLNGDKLKNFSADWLHVKPSNQPEKIIIGQCE